MLKKWIGLLAAGSILLTSCSNSGNPSEISASSSEGSSEAAVADSTVDLKRRSAEYLKQMQDGNFEPIYEVMTDELKSQAPRDQLVPQWDALISQIGPYQETLSIEFHEADGYRQVSITALHTLYQLLTTFVYDSGGKIGGLNNRTLPIQTEPQASDTWEEISIQVGDYNNNRLNGLLTLPKGLDKPPVAILVQGSGPTNMDEAIGTAPNRPFADIAHGLAEQGIASIRYDKRSYAYPQDVASAGIDAEYLEDVKAAVQMAFTDNRVDGERIFLIGHSQGGMLAPKFARDNPQIQGIVSMAGSLRRLEDILAEQNKVIMEQQAGLSDERKQAAIEQVQSAVEQIKSLDPNEKETIILGAPAIYWNSLNAVNSKELAQSLSIPMLILQGENDFQVPAEVDYKLWQDALSGKDNVSFKLYPGLSHLFMPSDNAVLDVAVYNIPAHVDPQVITDIADWIKQQ